MGVLVFFSFVCVLNNDVWFCELWFWGNDEGGYAVTWALLGLFWAINFKTSAVIQSQKRSSKSYPSWLILILIGCRSRFCKYVEVNLTCKHCETSEAGTSFLVRPQSSTDVISKWSSSDQNGSNCFLFCQSVNPQDCLHVLFIDVIPFFLRHQIL